MHFRQIFTGFGPRRVLIDHNQTLNRRFIDYWVPLGSFKTEMLEEMPSLRILAEMTSFFQFRAPPCRRFG